MDGGLESQQADPEWDQISRETDLFFQELSIRGVTVTPLGIADWLDRISDANSRSSYVVGRAVISLQERTDCSTYAVAPSLRCPTCGDRRRQPRFFRQKGVLNEL